MNEPGVARELSEAANLPAHELARIVATVTGMPVGRVRAGVVLTAEQQAEVARLVLLRRGGEPLQYLEGCVDFAGLELAVDHRALIPRPETEYLLELVGPVAGNGPVVDLCTGSGALALALKHRHPSARVVATDLSGAALELAAFNAQKHSLEVEWRQGDLYDALPDDLMGRVGLLVANPPYVADSEWSTLPADLLREPRMALEAGPTGREVVERILNGLDVWLVPGGAAWVEIGESQGRAYTERFPVTILSDQYGRDRFVHYRR
ncbi:MAG: N5-glutamine methyltransferase family protein [Actinomycetota bacterium]